MTSVRDVRTRLLLVVLAAVAAALVVATIGFNLLLTRSNNRGADALLRQRADSERSLIRIVRGRLAPTESSSDPVGDSRVWIFAGGRTLEAPRARAATAAGARSLAGSPRGFLTVESTDERLYAMPIVAHGRRIGTIVTGSSLAPYEQARRSALLGSLFFAATVLVIAGAAAAWLLRSALRPVELMTEQAEAWSEHDLDRRFGLGEPHDELTRLASTLDRLLDRIAASLRHERRFSAELSHELRTPLAKVTAEAELALRRPRGPEEYRQALDEILGNARQIARIVDALLAAAQRDAGPRGVSDGVEVAHAAADACRPIAERRGIALTVDEGRLRYPVGVDADLAERILHPIVDNACRYGRHAVSLSLARADGAVLFTVADDGPGVAVEEAEAIFEPAVRGQAGLDAAPSAGLGLALARRLARSVSGDIHAVTAATGGRFEIRLPAG
jgi:signal transduction histidine kinase